MRSPAPRFPAARTGAVQAFSLIEVVAAIGIFAFAMVAVLGLFSPIARSVVTSSDGEAAARIADVLRTRLQSMPFDEVAALLKNSTTQQGHELSDADAKADYDITQDPQLLFASRDGAKIGLYSDSVWTNPATRRNWDGEKFFEIALVRNESLSPKPGAAGSGGGGFGSGGAPTPDPVVPVLAYTARIRWPAFVADSATTAIQVGANPNSTVRFDHGRKQVLHFAGSITR